MGAPQQLLSSYGAIDAVYPADLYFSWALADGTAVSTANADTATTKRFPVWTVTATANAIANMVVDSGNAPATETDFSLNSVVTDGPTSGGIRTPVSVNSNYIQATLPASVGMPKFSAAFWLYKTHTDGDSMDAVRFHSLNGNYFVCNILGTTVRAHAVNGGTGFVNVATISAGTWYYVTMIGAQGAACTITVYASDKTTVIGTGSITPNSTSAFQRVDFGRGDNTAGTGTGSITIKGLVISHYYATVELGRNFVSSNYSPVTALTASDAFSGSGALSGNWTDGRAGWAQSGGAATFDTDGGLYTTFGVGPVAMRTGENWSNDQECSMTISTWDGWSGGPSVRMSGSDATLTGYGYQPSSGQARGFDRIVNNTNTGGSASGSGGARLANTTTTWAANDIMTLGVYGDATKGSIMLYLKKNGTFTGECVFDVGTSIASGDPAMWAFGPAFAADPAILDFSAANIVHS